MFSIFQMTWGIRRIVFTIGAILLVGGWGLTGYVDAYQHAAGAKAGERWRDGEQEPEATMRPSGAVQPVAGTPADSDTGAPAGMSARVRSTAGTGILRRVAPPSSWLYVLGVLIMMSGAGLMALTVPWRGARMTPAVEHVPPQRHVSPPPPKPDAVDASPPAPAPTPPPPPPPPAAAAFPGAPPLQAPQGTAGTPMQPPAGKTAGKAGGVKPLQYKKGA